ncbi:MAG: CDP-alcohol phosphatidyltransferase family protein, partial [Acidimicrobiia bacterium]
MDHVDGEYARLTGKTSKFGHYYDHVSAFTGYVALFIGVGFGMQETFGALAVPMGVIAGLAIAVTFTV